MCPKLARTSYSLPRNRLIVRAFAGDSTTTRVLDMIVVEWAGCFYRGYAAQVKEIIGNTQKSPWV